VEDEGVRLVEWEEDCGDWTVALCGVQEKEEGVPLGGGGRLPFARDGIFFEGDPRE
jgi:hypothetical protein